MKNAGVILTAVVFVLLVWANIGIGWESTGFHLEGLFNTWIHLILISVLVFYWSIVSIKTSHKVRERALYKALAYIVSIGSGILIAILLLPLLFFLASINH